MASYDLTISPKYIKGWGIRQAMREIFQNAIDHGDYSIERVDGDIIISSRGVTLQKKTLLLGEGTKSIGDGAIGQFGEGYKLALLTLLREGCAVAIKNGLHELWLPRIKKSRIYDCELLSIDVVKQHNDNCSLTFVISRISDGVWADIVGDTLCLQENYRQLKVTGKSFILTDQRHKGKIFVGGLFVSDSTLHYGYNLDPAEINLDRDRSMVRSFDLQWLTSRMWMSLSKTDRGLLIKLLSDGVPDVDYAQHHVWGSSELAEEAYAHFQRAYGALALPVSSQAEIDQLKRILPKTKFILVPENFAAVVRTSQGYIDAKEQSKIECPVENPLKMLTDYHRKFKSKMSIAELNVMGRILKCANFWEDNRVT
jgi:hypothetical protein